tara:strand:- start:103 stop:474 length:372 start_codon:yes stop_codon:yes gene_type:complete
MSIDSDRMLKLEAEVKELKTYINKIVGAVKKEAGIEILQLKKSVNEIKVYNKVALLESENYSKELKKELESNIDKKITFNNKSILNKVELPKMQLKESKQIDFKSEIKAVVTKEYINNIYRNK